MTDKDWTEDEDFAEWAEHVRSELFPKVKSSAVVMSLTPVKGYADVKFCVELGAAMCFDKPILVLHTKGSPPIPEKLRAVADEIIENFEFTSEVKQMELKSKLTAMMERIERPE